MGLVPVGERMNGNCGSILLRDADFHCPLLTEYLEHTIFNLLQPAKCEHANCSENESES